MTFAQWKTRPYSLNSFRSSAVWYPLVNHPYNRRIPKVQGEIFSSLSLLLFATKFLSSGNAMTTSRFFIDDHMVIWVNPSYWRVPGANPEPTLSQPQPTRSPTWANPEPTLSLPGAFLEPTLSQPGAFLEPTERTLSVPWVYPEPPEIMSSQMRGKIPWYPRIVLSYVVIKHHPHTIPTCHVW